MATHQNIIQSLRNCRGHETGDEIVKRFWGQLLEFRLEDVSDLVKTLESEDLTDTSGPDSLTFLFYRISRDLQPEVRLGAYQRIIANKRIAIKLLASGIQDTDRTYDDMLHTVSMNVQSPAALDRMTHLLATCLGHNEEHKKTLIKLRNILEKDKMQPCITPFALDYLRGTSEEILESIFTYVIETETDLEKVTQTVEFWTDLIGKDEVGKGKRILRQLYLDPSSPRAKENARYALILLGEYQLLSAAGNIQENIMGDKYVIGQAGAVGPNAHAHDMSFTQIWQSASHTLDLQQLAEELPKLRTKLKVES